MPTSAGWNVASPSEGTSRVLVTGLGGFTGRYVSESLKLRGLTAVDPAAVDSDFDLAEPESIGRVVDAAEADYVIHLAAVSFVAHGDPVDFYRVNTVGTVNLLEALSKAARPPRKVLIASSANIYGNVSGGKIDELTEPQPVNHYACSKFAMEKLAAQWSALLPIVVARPFNYTGVGQAEHFLIPKIVSHYARRAPVLELGNIDVVRDFSDVRTVADIYAELLACPAARETVNICSGVGHSLQWVLNACEELTGHAPQVVVNPAFVRSDEVKVLVGSNDKLSSLIGPLPARPFRETLEWMLAAYSAPRSTSGPN